MSDLIEQNSDSSTKSSRSLLFSPDDSIEIAIAPNAGACFGVVRAIKLGQNAIDRANRAKDRVVYSLGPLIHNPKVVGELERQGVRTMPDASSINDGTVVLRSHGVIREVEAALRKKGVSVVDATCPLVKKPQRIAQSLGDKNYFLVLVGDENHPEVKGVVSYFGKPDFLVTYRADDVTSIPEAVTRVGILAQTTIEAGRFEDIVAACRARFEEVAVYNTICDATSIRQSEAEQLARNAEVVIVVGGRNSSNTNKLVKICKDFQQETHLIEELDEIRMDWFLGKRKIGVTGGASTPMEYVDEVGSYIADLIAGHGRMT